MPVAYSDRLIVRSSISGIGPAEFISDLNLILLDAGWVITTTLTGGHIYEVTSAQTVDYKAHVLVQDNVNYKIDNPAADLYNFSSAVIRVMNVAETVKSFEYQVKTNNNYPSFQVIAGFSQLFLSVVGHIGTGWSSFACGIPWLPPDAGACVAGITPVIVDDIWWANGGSQFGFDWRTQPNCYACMSYYINGVVVIAADNNGILPWSGLLCLFPLTAVNTYAVPVNWPATIYSSLTAIATDAFIGWGWSIRGQLWDAYLLTGDGTIDTLVTAEDVGANGLTFAVRSITWYHEFYSRLQLIYEITGEAFGNVAY